MKLRNGALINDRYIIDDKIGSGGMAIVYRATDTKLDRTVTLKVMREDYIQDDEFIERFYTEAQAAGKLNHPNIVKVYDVDRIEDILFIVMEYINGITLKEAIRARKMFTNEEILGVSIQIASAIDCAHKNHIIHRDIKPQNILLTPQGEVKVTDFGIARAANAKTTTATATTLGSVHYFSPEQARGGYVDHKSDIYALGITMFEMASGVLPFDDETVVTIALKHINDDLPDIKELNPDVSESVINIIKKATEKSQMKRYDSAEIMGNDLKKSLANQNVNHSNDYEDLSLTQTLKISEDDMNKIRANNKKNVIIENVSDDYNDSVKTVKSMEREKYQQRQRENLKGRKTNRKRPSPDDDRKGNGKKIILYAILTGLVLSFILISFALLAYKGTLREEIDVPNLVSLSVDQATALGDEEGFVIEVVEYEDSDVYEEGTIIEQDYQVGQTIYNDGTIKVIVSSGNHNATVPDVTGMTEEDAIDAIEELGFVVKVNEISSDEVLEGRVVEQIPSADSTAEEGSYISIYVSMGEKEPEKTDVPNLVGLTEEEATSDLADASLQSSITYSESSTVEEGVVISQSISSGNRVDVNSSVTIVVSTGPADVFDPEEDSDGDGIKDGDLNGDGVVDDVDGDGVVEGDLDGDGIIDDLDGDGVADDLDTDDDGSEDNSTDTGLSTTKTIVVDQTMIPSGYETVFVKVIVDSTGATVYEQEVGVNDFPINIDVQGTGTESYTVYTKIEDGEYAPSAKKEVNFEG